MTFTFDPTLVDNVSLVRFHIGDTHSEGYYVADETISYWVAQGSVGSAVIACIRYIISQLSSPDFRQDWMQVSNKEARQGYETLLEQKQQEFGLSSSGSAVASSTVSLPSRADSYQTDNEYDGAP